MKLKIITTTNIFNLIKEGDALTIPTNGIVKQNGELIMGAGFAKEINSKAKEEIAKYLGKKVLQYGNNVYYTGLYKGVYFILISYKSEL